MISAPAAPFAGRKSIARCVERERTERLPCPSRIGRSQNACLASGRVQDTCDGGGRGAIEAQSPSAATVNQASAWGSPMTALNPCVQRMPPSDGGPAAGSHTFDVLHATGPPSSLGTPPSSALPPAEPTPPASRLTAGAVVSASDVRRHPHVQPTSTTAVASLWRVRTICEKVLTDRTPCTPELLVTGRSDPCRPTVRYRCPSRDRFRPVRCSRCTHCRGCRKSRCSAYGTFRRYRSNRRSCLARRTIRRFRWSTSSLRGRSHKRTRTCRWSTKCQQRSGEAVLRDHNLHNCSNRY